MPRKSVVVLDMIALIITGVWILYNLLRGLSSSDLIFSYLYSSVVMLAFILTLLEYKRL